MKKAIALAAMIMIIVSTAASAGVNTNAKVSIHVIPHASRTCAKNFPTITSQGDIIFTEPSGDVDAFPVFYDMVEYQGFDYGLNWPGTYSCAFTSCSDLAIGTITWPGDGVSHAWYLCQSATIGVPGWAWISEPSPSIISIVDHPTVNSVLVGDCGSPATLDTVYEYERFYSGIGGEIGQPVEATTWGKIKAQFK
jgi:hypothetical protein